jgi:hypothetical protein
MYVIPNFMLGRKLKRDAILGLPVAIALRASTSTGPTARKLAPAPRTAIICSRRVGPSPQNNRTLRGILMI